MGRVRGESARVLLLAFLLALVSASCASPPSSTGGAPPTAPSPSSSPLDYVVFAKDVSIPLDRTGHYLWETEDVPFEGLPSGFVFTYDVKGQASVSQRVHFDPVLTEDGIRVEVSFDVDSFETGASLFIGLIEASRGGE